MATKKRWNELTAGVKVQGAEEKWAAITAINFIGPILYFTCGRRGKDAQISRPR